MGEMTLGEFMKQLALRMHDAKLILLFKDEKPWHMLFYRLKRSELGEKPRFLASLRFDWDGPYPKCRQLSEFIQALHWTGSVTAGNPSYEQITLQEDVHRLWEENKPTLSPELEHLVAQGVSFAKEEFPSQSAPHA